MSKIRSEFPQTPLNLTLREEQISTILYCLEGYSQGNDDYELVEELTKSLKSWKLLLTSFTRRLKRQEQKDQRRNGNGTTQTCVR